jgi:hypothetical protein
MAAAGFSNLLFFGICLDFIDWYLRFVWYLEFDYWNLSGVWLCGGKMVGQTLPKAEPLN